MQPARSFKELLEAARFYSIEQVDLHNLKETESFSLFGHMISATNKTDIKKITQVKTNATIQGNADTFCLKPNLVFCSQTLSGLLCK